MKKISEDIPGYTYGTPQVAASSFSLKQLDDLKISAGFTAEDERYLRLAGEVLADQTKQITDHQRPIDAKEQNARKAKAGMARNSFLRSGNSGLVAEFSC